MLMSRVRMADLPLAVKMGVAPAVALAMLAVLGATGLYSQLRSTGALRNAVEVQMPHSAEMNGISRELVATHGELYRLLTQQGAKIDTTQIDTRMKALSARFDVISRRLSVARDHAAPAERPLFTRVLKQVSDTHSAVDLIGAMIGSDFATAAGFAAPFEDSYQQMSRTLAPLNAKDTPAIAVACCRPSWPSRPSWRWRPSPRCRCSSPAATSARSPRPPRPSPPATRRWTLTP